MKKLSILLLMAATLALSCVKEKPVVVSHPLSVDVEAGKQTVSIPAVWIDMTGDGEGATALDTYLGKSSDQFVMVVTKDDFQGGAQEWFDSHVAAWPCAKYYKSLTTNGKLYFMASGRQGAGLTELAVNDDALLECQCSEFVIVLGEISENNIGTMLNSVWLGTDKTAAIFALLLQEASTTLSDATFTDCIAAQFGQLASSGTRSRYLYTSAGVWNCLSSMEKGSLAGAPLTNVLSFNINVEEGRL